MRSSATPRFWKCYAALPRTIQQQAREGYAFFGQDPYHPSLRFKRVHSARPIFSVRISLEYRALGSWPVTRSPGSGLVPTPSMTVF